MDVDLEPASQRAARAAFRWHLRAVCAFGGMPSVEFTLMEEGRLQGQLWLVVSGLRPSLLSLARGTRDVCMLAHLLVHSHPTPRISEKLTEEKSR